MLTRIEIDGFKSFEKFALDLSPFVVILGPNAAGKSNLFDAIHFLSNLASKDLREAVQDLRGEVEQLFRHEGQGVPTRKMHLAVEVLIEPKIRDLWGIEMGLSHSRIRYELTIERRVDQKGIERLMIAREQAIPIMAREDQWKKRFSDSKAFRLKFFKYGRRSPWLETENVGDQVIVIIRPDGKTGRRQPVNISESTVLSSITTMEFPHLLALREEMRSWRFLQLNPFALRRPTPIGPIFSTEMLKPDGSNLAAVLARIKAETSDEMEPVGALADISADLTQLIPEIVGFHVHEDHYAQQYQFFVKMKDGNSFPPSLVSDGTLRILALLAMLYDPKYQGLLCFEEPENGIHPARLHLLIQHLRERAADPQGFDDDPDAPLVQLLINSHSPVVLSALRELGNGNRDIFFADLVTSIDPENKTASRKTRIRPVIDKQNQVDGEIDVGVMVTRFEVERYLDTVNKEG